MRKQFPSKQMWLTIMVMVLMSFSSLWAEELPAQVRQMVVVLTDNWDTFHGRLYLVAKTEQGWQVLPGHWPVTVGRNGLGWGLGVFAGGNSGPRKREGDGKSPAGMFLIRTRLYGYATEAPSGVRLSYTQLTPDWLGIDDPASRYYNQLVNRSEIATPDWNSWEDLRRSDDLYQWLLMVEHNTQPVSIAGAGSCIFIHLWRHEQAPTAGCTAMSAVNMLQLLQWLDPTSMPVLLQIPSACYQEYESRFGLPALTMFPRERGWHEQTPKR